MISSPNTNLVLPNGATLAACVFIADKMASILILILCFYIKKLILYFRLPELTYPDALLFPDKPLFWAIRI